MAMYDVRFKIDYEKCTEENKDSFLAEYSGMNYHKSLQEFRYKASKIDMYPEDKLFFEMLCDIKKDLLELKNLKKDEFLKLSDSTFANAIDYELIAVDDKLQVGCEYYLRFSLQDKTMAVFAIATDVNLLKITKIKRFDEENLSHYVVDIQRNLIYKKREEDGN